jgi:ribosomal protein L27
MCAKHNKGVFRDAGTIQRQRGANAHQRGTSIDPGEDINLQLCVDLPMKANALNQVTFKITPHDFAQKASLEM